MATKRKLGETAEEAADVAGETKKACVEYKNPNDWTCPNCGDHVYASRPACRKCGTTRDEAGAGTRGNGQLGPSSENPNGGKYKNPNDWTCPNCGDHVFAARPACRKCFTQRPGGPVKPTESPHGNRPGDWYCPTCQGHNFATRHVCRKCNTSKYATPAGYDGMMTMQQQMGVPMGMGQQMVGGMADLGSYYDPYAQQQQHEQHQNGVGVAAGGAAAVAVGGYDTRRAADPYGIDPYGAAVAQQGEQAWGAEPAAGARGGNARPGDWSCPSCNFLVYASKAACPRCNSTRSGDRAYFGDSAASRGMVLPGGQTTRPGDWNCPSCGDHNFASRMECRQCNTAKGGANLI